MKFFSWGCLSAFWIIILLWIGGASINPFRDGMFDMHDLTQVGRIENFVLNLEYGKIPPRLAPEFSFSLGFPVFSFYAPAAYWISSVFVLMGASAAFALKISFCLSFIIAFFSMRYFLSRWMFTTASILGAMVYVTSTYFATEIMIRGNLAECWFLALLPLALGLLIEQSRKDTQWLRFSTPLVLALLYVTHNMFGLFAIPITIATALILPEKKKNLIACALALCLSASFLLPAFAEGHFTQATQVAKEYAYAEHFLCPWQIWTAKGWGFGGSLPGCDADSMSFKLGKIQLILAGLGVFSYALVLRSKRTRDPFMLVLGGIAILSAGGLLLTLEVSKPLWDLFSPIMALFQFPWRFLVFGLFGIAVFTGFWFTRLPKMLRLVLFIPLLCILCIPARKYFIKPLTSLSKYQEQYGSEWFVQNQLAFGMREYIARDVDYVYWNSLRPPADQMYSATPSADVRSLFPIEPENAAHLVSSTPFEKHLIATQTGDIKINLHSFPYWQILVNGKPAPILALDHLARPSIAVQNGDKIDVFYAQTPIEKFANFLSLFGVVMLLFAYATTRSLKQVESHTV